MASTDSVGSATGSDFVVHIEVDTCFDTDCVGIAQVDMMVVSSHPDLTPHSSTSRYRRFFL